MILVHLCRRYFSDPPYSCIPEADCRNVYLFMYDLYSFATYRCKYFYAMLIYQPYRCIEMGNFAPYCYWCKAAPPPPPPRSVIRDRAETPLYCNKTVSAVKASSCIIYARETTQVLLYYCYILAKNRISVKVNNNKKFRSFKSIENIHKKEVGPYRGFGY